MVLVQVLQTLWRHCMNVALSTRGYLRRCSATFGLMQQLVRDFMHEDRELLGFRLSRKDGDAPAVAPAERGSDVLGEDKLDSLLLHEREKTVAVLANIAAHLTQCGNFRAFGLRDIKDIGIAKANKNTDIRTARELISLDLCPARR
jgi:hypothetical protein